MGGLVKLLPNPFVTSPRTFMQAVHTGTYLHSWEPLRNTLHRMRVVIWFPVLITGWIVWTGGLGVVMGIIVILVYFFHTNHIIFVLVLNSGLLIIWLASCSAPSLVSVLNLLSTILESYFCSTSPCSPCCCSPSLGCAIGCSCSLVSVPCLQNFLFSFPVFLGIFS